MTDVNFPQDFYLDDVGVWRLKKEKLAELEKPKPMTNEEWLRSATTEELAKVLYSVWVNGFFEQKNSVPEDINNLIIAWLKEKHTNE